MPTFRENPYGAFNFLVALGDAQGTGSPGEVVGGFSEASGLGVEIDYAEYRNGNEMVNTSRKVPNVHKFDDVTLKRGVVGSEDLFNWVRSVAEGNHAPRPVDIILLDEARDVVATWHLTKAQPKKWTGPTLNAKGGTEVAMEELSLCHEGISFS